MSDDAKGIRELAYQIWESEGRPDGQHHRHWQMACKLAEAQTQQAPQPLVRTKVTKPRAAPEKSSAADKPASGRKALTPRSRPAKTTKPAS